MNHCFDCSKMCWHSKTVRIASVNVSVLTQATQNASVTVSAQDPDQAVDPALLKSVPPLMEIALRTTILSAQKTLQPLGEPTFLKLRTG